MGVRSVVADHPEHDADAETHRLGGGLRFAGSWGFGVSPVMVLHLCSYSVYPGVCLVAAGGRVAQRSDLTYVRGVRFSRIVGVGGDVQSLQSASFGLALEEAASPGVRDSGFGFTAYAVVVRAQILRNGRSMPL